MIIEFFGFPGSGKTTVCNELLRELREENIKTVRGTFDHLKGRRRLLGKIFFSFIGFFYNPMFFIKNVLFFSKSRSLSDFLNITYLYGRYSHYKKTNKIILFDQGLAQAFLSVYSFAGGGRSYDPSFLFRKIEKIIILRLDFEENKERLFSREDQSSRVQQNKERLKDLRAAYEEVEKQVIRNLKENQLLKIDSAKPADSNVLTIREQLNI